MTFTEMIEDMIDHDCKVEIGDCFMYRNGVITVNPFEGYMQNLEWKRFLKERFNFNLTRRNWFIMSVLHELGHHYTLQYFTKEETLASQKSDSTEWEHYNEPVELLATAWATQFYMLNIKAMQKWEEIIMNNI